MGFVEENIDLKSGEEIVSALLKPQINSKISLLRHLKLYQKQTYPFHGPQIGCKTASLGVLICLKQSKAYCFPLTYQLYCPTTLLEPGMHVSSKPFSAIMCCCNHLFNAHFLILGIGLLFEFTRSPTFAEVLVCGRVVFVYLFVNINFPPYNMY